MSTKVLDGIHNSLGTQARMAESMQIRPPTATKMKKDDLSQLQAVSAYLSYLVAWHKIDRSSVMDQLRAERAIASIAMFSSLAGLVQQGCQNHVSFVETGRTIRCLE